MKNSRGFCLVQELVCFCLMAVLLATAIQGFYRSNYLLNQSLELQQAVQAAQQVLAGEEYSGRFDVTQRISSGSADGLAVQEVQAAYGKVRVTLIRALPTAEGLSASGAAVGTFAGSSAGDVGL
jgi:type II secretory pathway component PulJ